MSKSIYPSIPSPGNDVASMRTTLDAMRQSLNMIIMNAQKPSANFTPSSSAQIFLTRQQFKDGGVVGPAGPPGAQGPPGVSGIPDAPNDVNTYGRHANAWVAITTGGSGGIPDAPNDGTTYARNSLAWQHLTHTDISDWTSSLSAYAPLLSPSLAGVPLAPTATAGTNNTQIATTQFVASAIAAMPSGGVSSFNTRTGAVTLSSADVTNALTYTPYNSTNPANYQTATQVTASLGAYLPLTGGSLTGNLTVGGVMTLNADPTSNLQAATKQYVDAHAGMADAPSDGTTYGRNNGAWSGTID